MKTIELHYNVRVAQGHRFAKDVLRPWPEGASLGDVMAELTTELQSLGCSDITVTRAERPAPLADSLGATENVGSTTHRRAPPLGKDYLK
jgi:hypothetical protein